MRSGYSVVLGIAGEVYRGWNMQHIEFEGTGFVNHRVSTLSLDCLCVYWHPLLKVVSD